MTICNGELPQVLEDIVSPHTWIQKRESQEFELMVIGGSEGTERFPTFESPDLIFNTILGAFEEIHYDPFLLNNDEACDK